MQHERLEPGTHLRKNQKQVLAMLRAAVGRSGLIWDPVDQTGSVTKVALRPAEGAEPKGEATVAFSTDGVELSCGPVGGEAREALALYTDTRWMLETLEACLADLAG